MNQDKGRYHVIAVRFTVSLVREGGQCLLQAGDTVLHQADPQHSTTILHSPGDTCASGLWPAHAIAFSGIVHPWPCILSAWYGTAQVGHEAWKQIKPVQCFIHSIASNPAQPAMARQTLNLESPPPPQARSGHMHTCETPSGQLGT